MIRRLLDHLAYRWLDRRTAPPATRIRFHGGPLDGTTGCDTTGTPTGEPIGYHADDGRWYAYRADGTQDPDGAHRLHHDPTQEDQ